MQDEKTKEIRYIDLFGGVGGFRLGIERANNSLSQSKNERPKERGKWTTNEQGTQFHDRSNTTLTCVWYNDIDKYAVQTYNKNFKENWKATDIRAIKTSEIPDFDMLCAGFPCQAFSIAGKRRGFQDTRGTLFFEITRIVKAKRPKVILLENVKGLLNHDKGQTFSIILQTLSELGYDVQWMVLNSKFFGVPQNRERVFIVGSTGGTTRSEILPFGETSEKFNKRDSEKQVTSSLQHPGHSGGNYRGMTMIYKKLGKVYGNKDVAQAHRVYSPEGVITSQRGNTQSLIRTNQIRRLTPIECERLQGFPDNWTEGVSDTQRYKQIGNAVTVNVVQAIVEGLFK